MPSLPTGYVETRRFYNIDPILILTSVCTLSNIAGFRSVPDANQIQKEANLIERFHLVVFVLVVAVVVVDIVLADAA